MTFRKLWRIWFAFTALAIALCLLGSVWGPNLVISHFFPMAFNQAYVSYWWLALLVVVPISSLFGIALILFDASFSLASRVTWAVLLVGFSPLQVPLAMYWLFRIELPKLKSRATSA